MLAAAIMLAHFIAQQRFFPALTGCNSAEHLREIYVAQRTVLPKFTA